jgi:mRNA-degrading endonuclease RelE of RelBE toxin-antitoxin system
LVERFYYLTRPARETRERREKKKNLPTKQREIRKEKARLSGERLPEKHAKGAKKRGKSDKGFLVMLGYRF